MKSHFSQVTFMPDCLCIFPELLSSNPNIVQWSLLLQILPVALSSARAQLLWCHHSSTYSSFTAKVWLNQTHGSSSSPGRCLEWPSNISGSVGELLFLNKILTNGRQKGADKCYFLPPDPPPEISRPSDSFHMAFSEMSPVSKQPPVNLYEVIACLIIYYFIGFLYYFIGFLSVLPFFTSLSLTLVALGLQPLTSGLHVSFAVLSAF